MNKQEKKTDNVLEIDKTWVAWASAFLALDTLFMIFGPNLINKGINELANFFNIKP